jgi:tetratricopeptide (TPR) repeat protein
VNARCRGDVDGARKLYQSILDVTPNDPEALCGMGDIARQEDNWDTARNFYAEALRANPAFMPAALGAADVEWEVGNLPVAQRKYREIVDAFPNATTPPRVQERAAPPCAARRAPKPAATKGTRGRSGRPRRLLHVTLPGVMPSVMQYCL